ncbi:flagellar basal-body rod modification protein FlgD [Granulicella rosea]|uniref:Basal-body rod modification protein FlgD n=1 Tax=Granulicella rosea TaxID=474952 RepID=A0A239ELS8_9BACT|nr:flagellar hook capping FlgD N-terminal domain-containing protein [Granulicella rosea]SNS44993.1 flagellar basal-body rod modification protein FlgD [Granulicella rosea]
MELTSNTLHNSAQSVANSMIPTASAAKPMDTSTSTTSTSTAGDITSDDFLTLLVTEMKNQDPTQPTDPNAYIQQLVGVNSLQQLISINQELGAATGASGSSSSSAIAVTPSTSAL